jgi:hypothetical protein
MIVTIKNKLRVNNERSDSDVTMPGKRLTMNGDGRPETNMHKMTLVTLLCVCEDLVEGHKAGEPNGRCEGSEAFWLIVILLLVLAHFLCQVANAINNDSTSLSESVFKVK